MKKNQKWLLNLLLAMVLFILPVTVYADMGPKPSVTITFQGLENEDFYVTLLSQWESTGPYSLGNPYYDWMGEESVFNKFCEYEDPDGYNFLSYMEDCSDDETFEWGYYPPQSFKILLYFPDKDVFLEVDGVYERYAFDSYFSVDVTNLDAALAGSESVQANTSYYYTMEIISLVARIILTIVVEILVALLFGYRNKKALFTITLTNIVTQVILNVLLNIINFQSGQYAFVFHYVWMEIVVFAIETFIYRKCIESQIEINNAKRLATCYALVANIVSFVVGMWLAQTIPGIF